MQISTQKYNLHDRQATERTKRGIITQIYEERNWNK